MKRLLLFALLSVVSMAARATEQWNFLKPLPFRPEQVEVGERGNLYILGRLTRPAVLLGDTLRPEKKGELVLVKYSPQIVPIWVRRIRSDSALGLGDLVYSQTHGLVFSGGHKAVIRVDTVQVPYFLGGSFLASFDTSGAVRFVKNLADSNRVITGRIPLRLHFSPRGPLFILYSGVFGFASTSVIAQVGLDGTIGDTVFIQQFLDFPVTDFTFARNGDLVLTMVTRYQGGAREATVFRYDSAGNEIWHTAVEYDSPVYVVHPYRIIAKPDGGFLLSVVNPSFDGTYSYYVFTDGGSYSRGSGGGLGLNLHAYSDSSYFVTAANGNTSDRYCTVWRGGAHEESALTGCGITYNVPQSERLGYPTDMGSDGSKSLYMVGFTIGGFTLEGMALEGSEYYIAQYGACTVPGVTASESNGSIVAQPAGLQYQWYVNGIYECGEDRQTISVERSGAYHARVTGGFCRNQTNAVAATPSGARRPKWRWAAATRKPGYSGYCIESYDNQPEDYVCATGNYGVSISTMQPNNQAFLATASSPDGGVYALVHVGLRNDNHCGGSPSQWVSDNAFFGNDSAWAGRSLVKYSPQGKPLWVKQLSSFYSILRYGDTSLSPNVISDVVWWDNHLVLGGSANLFIPPITSVTAPALVFMDTGGVAKTFQMEFPPGVKAIHQMAVSPTGDLVVGGLFDSTVVRGNDTFLYTAVFVCRISPGTHKPHSFAYARMHKPGINSRPWSQPTISIGNFPSREFESFASMEGGLTPYIQLNRASLTVLPNGAALVKLAADDTVVLGNFTAHPGVKEVAFYGQFVYDYSYYPNCVINAIVDTGGVWRYVADSVLTPVAALADNSFLAGRRRVQYGTWAEAPIADPDLAKAEIYFKGTGGGVLAARNAYYKTKNLALAYFNPDLSLLWKQTVTGCGQTPTSVAYSAKDSSLILAGVAFSKSQFSNSVYTTSGYGGFLVKIGNTPLVSTRPGLSSIASLRAYPNPASSEIRVESRLLVTLQAMDGRTMATAEPIDGIAVFHLKALPAGLYLLRSADGKTARIVKV